MTFAAHAHNQPQHKPELWMCCHLEDVVNLNSQAHHAAPLATLAAVVVTLESLRSHLAPGLVVTSRRS